ncbi:hypothetical protein [Xenophilus sp. Marseille-Q4582]|uniref:hypothetical protein n=1 Tax=Xenophilus sp. Marseille-Q4582 TaxID=2866600 RepID=UPI001CE433DA|nr:hypothetical protein [Xenophilus sp. Marseille-Q4582]
MAHVIADRVLETTTTTGTGTYTLAGAVTGFRAFSAACANGDTVDAFVEAVDSNGVPTGDWEVGTYTWGTGGTLTRTSVAASSNAGSAVNWPAGTKRVGLGVPAGLLAQLRGADAVNALAIASGVVNIDLSLGNYFTLALTANVTNITFTNAPSAGRARSLMLRITQDSTARTVAWPSSFRWEGSAPAVSTGSGAVDLLALTSFDQGTKWDATLSKGRV